MVINKLISVLLISSIILIFSNYSFAQTAITKRKSERCQPKISKLSKSNLSEEEREQEESKQMEKEALYYAPIRYVIVYNNIFYHNPNTGELNIVGLGDEKYQEAGKLDDAQRRMDILILPEQFNRQNLIKVFALIKKRFPLPVSLEVNVHTTLATIETPEETEMAHDSRNLRFKNQENKYKNAYYRRDQDEENFCYTTSLLPYKNRWAYPFKSGASISPC